MKGISRAKESITFGYGANEPKAEASLQLTCVGLSYSR
jgi:hypothetical protein